MAENEGRAQDRADWINQEIARIRGGGTIRVRCTMAQPERVDMGLCLGEVPEDRAHRGATTCSEQCRLDQKRLRRWELAKGKCEKCGRGLPKKRAPRKPKAVIIPESGNEVNQ